MKQRLTLIASGLILALICGCANWSKAAKGALMGGAAGGLIGGIIGKKTGNTAAGVIVGSAVGGVAGASIGAYMDKQAKDLKEVEGAKVERIGEGIKMTFDSGILFDVGKANLKPPAQESIKKMVDVLKKYPETEVLVQGHTDSDGSAEYNQKLSEERAASVVIFANKKGIKKGRMTAVGYGEEMPVADNTTAEGKAQNRRVEIAIVANEELKKSAEDGEKM